MTSALALRRPQLEVVRADDGWETPPPFGVELGSSFGYNDRLYYAWGENGEVMDYGDWTAQEMHGMFKRDYQSRKMESALALPILSAERQIVGQKGDKGELDWLQGFWDLDQFEGGCANDLDEIIGHNTSAITFRKAFYELVFDVDDEGKTIYSKIAFRPQTTCRTIRDAANGDLLGFEQEPYALSPGITGGTFPIKVYNKRAYIYIHGQRLDPINGTSDLEVAHWCYKTKQKLLFLWFQFLEQVSLPRTIVKANDETVAKQIAAQIQRMRGSAVLPIGTGGATNTVEVSTLESSGKGGDQFKEAITWLDQAATQSVLLGFLDLTTGASQGNGGGYALSKNASNLFLQFEEAKTREIEKSIRRGLFAPLIRYNFGPGSKVPKLKFEPLNAEDKSDQIGMLNSLLANRTAIAKIPEEFIAELAMQVGQYFGMDGTKIHDSFIQAAKDAQALAAQQSAAGASPLGQQAAAMTGVTNAAAAIVGGNAQLPKPDKAAQAAGATRNSRQARQVGGKGGGGRSIYQTPGKA